MKQFSKRAYLVAGLCAIFWGWIISARANPGAASDEDAAVRKADHAFVEAVDKADKTALEHVLDADFTWTDAAGKTLTRAEVLVGVPKPGISDESGAQIVERNYGRVEMVQAHSGKANIMRLWAKRPAGWRILIYQEANLLDGSPVPTGTAATCDNPCKTLPYTPKNDNERDVLNSYMALQTATVYHKSEDWGKHVADEFSAASSNSNQVLDKKGRMADLERSKMAGYSPMPVVTMRLFDFGDTFILVSKHQPLTGKPMHMTRLWTKRDGQWMEVASYQTRIQGAPAK
jgi:hypothetical protein